MRVDLMATHVHPEMLAALFDPMPVSGMCVSLHTGPPAPTGTAAVRVGDDASPTGREDPLAGIYGLSLRDTLAAIDDVLDE
jgi:hypothetical protein